MVKGVAKQAVVIRPRETDVYEQAIFIMAPDSGGATVASAEELVALADRIASEYTLPALKARRRPRLLTHLLAFAFGGGVAVAAFFAAGLLG